MSLPDVATTNFTELFARLVGRAGGTVEHADGLLLAGGDIAAPGLVNVAILLGPVDDAAAVVERAEAFHTGRRFALQVPNTFHEGLADELARRDYREVVRLTAMVIDEPPADATPGPGYRLADVGSAADVEDFVAIVNDVFGSPEPPSVGTFLFDRADAFDEPDSHAVIVRTGAGEPAACGLAILVEGVVGAAMIATRKEHRRRGLGRWATQAVVQWGFDAGASQGALLSSPIGRSVYGGMGFREVGWHGLYMPA